MIELIEIKKYLVSWVVDFPLIIVFIKQCLAFIGLVFCIYGIKKFIDWGLHKDSHGVGRGLSYGLTGVLLINIEASKAVADATLFRTPSAFSYTPVSGGDSEYAFITSLLFTLLFLIGLYHFAAGATNLRHIGAASGNGKGEALGNFIRIILGDIMMNLPRIFS